ncbi:MAG: helix-turn-helix domain-containing protein [Lachnospiraceae bacterium]|nr:helix-turn-helix domain-containing protein [Lachnospiraceae bacterium]
MTVGERIKKIRIFRKMTIDELGAALGFEGKNMSVRVSQYETGDRIPREDMILRLADALNCNYKALSDYGSGSAEDIIETLFWLEESTIPLPARGKGPRFPEYTGPGNLIHLSAMIAAKKQKETIMTYDKDSYDTTEPPVAITFDYGLVNEFLSEWNDMKTKLYAGEISPNEYFEWKITWPHTEK